MTAFNSKFSLIANQAIAILAIVAFVSIHFSPALVSISLGLAFALSLAVVICQPDLLPKIPAYLYVFSALYVWQLLTSLLIGNQEGLGQKLLLKLPLLLLPALCVQYLEKSRQRLGLLLANLVMCWLSLASVVNYLRHFRFYNQMILESKPLPLYSQVYHIEFSVILACTAMLGLVWLWLNRSALKEFQGQLLAVTALLNVLCLHLLSARTGIVCFWAGGVVVVLYGILKGRINKYLVFGALGLLVIGVFSLPSVRNRLVNTYDDLSAVVHKRDLNDRSFGQRWEAWKASLHVVKTHPAVGVGMKGVESALAAAYVDMKSGLQESKRVMPHNEYLDEMVQSGIPAGLFLLLLLGWGVAYALRKGNLYLLVMIPAMAMAMMFESLLERQAGVMLFAMVLWFCHSVSEKKEWAERPQGT